MTPHRPCGPRDTQRGAALALTLIAITALLGLGALTVLSVQTEISSGGQSRFGQAALYAAESGTMAGMDFLRTNCSTQSLFAAWVEPSNTNPQQPADIVGNNKQPGQDGNPFDPDLDLWYTVEILNNRNDAQYAAGGDQDGIVILRSTGRGPDQTVAIVELEVYATDCVRRFCESEYAQRGVTARNDAYAACSARIQNTTLRTINPTP
jgi:hypothetical protein